MSGSSLLLVTLLGLSGLVNSADNETRFCKPAPRWAIGGEAPMLQSYGQVTVVALLQASCGFCLVQAANMGPLRDKLTNQGLTNISYIIVNDQSSLSRILFPKLVTQAPPGVPVYQQLPEQEDVWEVLDGSKDDFLIYDRCGRLTFHIRLPYSYLHFPFVEAAINTTYYEDSCQNCSFYANVTWTAKNDVSSKDPMTGKMEKPEKDKPIGNKGDKSGEHHGHSEGPGTGGHRPHHPSNHEEVTDNNAHRPITSKGNTDEKSNRPIHNHGPQSFAAHI
ncbi:PREDICTED: selenoprotein Pb-like isoform X2 [Nanorana parkeri]|uniref:selenoprotein Pb-like isoform X2 n=1 Tax=Nanorana parkeri TaxID=125878 RepID=UPI0008550B4E|nr:PREDICTED: selenoprotein Pb-like isoform X2 [Nanorana parkeri]